MFCGANSVNLDSKGRFAIPTKYREILSDGMVCTIGLKSPCLALYPQDEWQIIIQKLTALSSMVEIEKRISRLLLGHAVEMVADSAGRILLPKPLRHYAKLEKETMFIGQGNKFEIWDEALWNNQVLDDLNFISDGENELSDNLKNLTL